MNIFLQYCLNKTYPRKKICRFFNSLILLIKNNSDFVFGWEWFGIC